MCLADNHRYTEAVEAFEQALVLLPENAIILRSYGTCLAAHGKSLRARNELEEAEPVLRKALHMVPGQTSAWIDLGVVLRSLGRIEEALAAFRQAEELLRRQNASSPGLQDAITGVLSDAGRAAEALANARVLVARHPAHASAQESLSRLLWEHGAELAPDDDPLGEFRAAARARPGDREFQLAFVRLLLATKRADEALARLHPLLRRDPGDALLQWFAADALDAMERHPEAAIFYAAAARGGLDTRPEFLNAHARHAFLTRDFDLAELCASRAVQVDPCSQEGWALLGTAWRLRGDEREHWLYGYDRLIGYLEVATPPGFRDQPAFLHALGARLNSLHGAGREPMHQSVRGGTQTPGQLFGRDDVIVRAAERALRAGVEQWLGALPDDADHPFLSRRQRSVRFVGSWSISLKSSGRHSNHIHPRGWASSAFYVALPEAASDAAKGSFPGWLQFGQPLEDLRLDLPPRRVIQPRVGHLALFPSYMWHGTLPFQEGGQRLTIAFDLQPRRACAGLAGIEGPSPG